MSAEREVLVIGGGLAGTAAAVTLARAGRRVALIEREPRARNKVCGEFLSGEALQLLRALGVNPRTLGAVPVEGVRLCSGRTTTEARLPFPAHSLTRLRLDAEMLSLASDAGVEVRTGIAVESLRESGGRWEATLSDGARLGAEEIILATGKHDLRGSPRPMGLQGNLLAMKMYWRLEPRQTAALAGYVELLLHPGGYTGLQCVESGETNLTALISRRSYTKLGGWEGFLAMLKASSRGAHARLGGAEPLLPKPLAISPIPYGFVRREAPGERFRAVGDQAAVIPSFTGDGMSIALYSGVRAAEGLLRGEAANTFQRTLHRELRGQVWRATALSLALVREPSASAIVSAVRLWPGLLRGAARATRVPEAGLGRLGLLG